jgi:hypothetical protein
MSSSLEGSYTQLPGARLRWSVSSYRIKQVNVASFQPTEGVLYLSVLVWNECANLGLEKLTLRESALLKVMSLFLLLLSLSCGPCWSRKPREPS